MFRLNRGICLVSMQEMHITQTSIFESFEKCIQYSLLESVILPIAKDLANQFMGCTTSIDFIVEEAVKKRDSPPEKSKAIVVL